MDTMMTIKPFKIKFYDETGLKLNTIKDCNIDKMKKKVNAFFEKFK